MLRSKDLARVTIDTTVQPKSPRRSAFRPTQLAEQVDVHANQITAWKAQLESGAADVFGPVAARLWCGDRRKVAVRTTVDHNGGDILVETLEDALARYGALAVSFH